MSSGIRQWARGTSQSFAALGLLWFTDSLPLHHPFGVVLVFGAVIALAVGFKGLVTA